MTARPTIGVALLTLGMFAAAAAAQWTERTVETVRVSEVQVLTSGPVHEAFAETVVFDPEPDLVVLAPPPPPIDEIPPDQMPVGPDMTWIPGYWAWDDDRSDYLWVSGIWRSVPPGRRYVPGFWTRVGHGYQWTSGFWLDEEATDIVYLPEPPDPIVEPPPPLRPSPNLIWTPGTWVWDQDRYLWRPGHWVEASTEWVWVPAHYVWGPHGYVFVDGYWDYPVERRGLLFAPVYVHPVVRTMPHFVYAPTTVIDLDIFTEHLFIRPRYRHYYFGDYYANVYVDKGIYPWFAVHSRRVAYDPIYVHRRWRHRDEPDWERHIEARYQHRREHENERPPRTLEVQLRLGDDRVKAAATGFVVAKSLQQIAQQQGRSVRFRAVERNEREELTQRAREVAKTREARKEIETRDAAPGAEPVRRTTPTRERVPATPITAKKDAASSRAAPKKPDAPQVDRTVPPQPKKKVERVTREPGAPPASAPPPQPPAAERRPPEAGPSRAAPPPQPPPPDRRPPDAGPARPVPAPPPPPERKPPDAKPDRPDAEKGRPPEPPGKSRKPEVPPGQSQPDDKEKKKKDPDD